MGFAEGLLMRADLVLFRHGECRDTRRPINAQGGDGHAAAREFITALVVALTRGGFVTLATLGGHGAFPTHGAHRWLCIGQGQQANRQRGNEQSSDSVVFHV